MTLPITIRTMTFADVDFAIERTAAEGWAVASRELFESFILRDAEGCFLALLDGAPIGTCIATAYAHSGFVGDLIVLPELRGQGIGAALVQHSLSYFRSRGIEEVYLDGVPKAAPLYERCGFHTICRSLRFAGTISGRAHDNVRPMLLTDLPEVAALDLAMFGEERSFFLKRNMQHHPGICLVMRDGDELTGFLTGRQGEGWISIGPLVTAANVDPTPLLEHLSCLVNEREFSAGVLEFNTTSVEWLCGLGLQERSSWCWRMCTSPSGKLGNAGNCWMVGSAAKG